MTDRPSYLTLQQHYEQRLREHGDNHRGVDWPNRPDAEKRYDVMLGLIGDAAAPASLLDIGCGLAHLYDRIVEKRLDTQLSYEGLDISPPSSPRAAASIPISGFMKRIFSRQTPPCGRPGSMTMWC